MKRIVHFCLALILLAVMPFFAQAQTPTAEDHELKMKEVHEVLTLIHTEEIQKQMLKTLFAQFRSAETKVPESFWVKMEDKMTQSLPDLNEQLALIYDRHFSQADIEALIAFYKTPTGQRFLAELPKVSQESMLVGQSWGQNIGTQVDKELKAAGYE
jgi:uncharacterized protein